MVQELVGGGVVDDDNWVGPSKDVMEDHEGRRWLPIVSFLLSIMSLADYT